MNHELAMERILDAPVTEAVRRTPPTLLAADRQQ